MILRVSLFTLLAVLASACGQADRTSTQDSSETSTTTTTPASAVSPQGAVTDVELATKMLLVAADLPDARDWEVVAAEPVDDAQRTINRLLATCLGRPDPATTSSADVNGATFTSGDNSVSSNVQMMHSVDDVSADGRAFTSAKVPECLRPIVQDEISRQLAHLVARGATLSSRVGKIPGLIENGNVFGWRVTTTITAGPESSELYADLIGFLHDRVEGTINASYVGVTPPISLENSLASKMQQRARDVMKTTNQ